MVYDSIVLGKNVRRQRLEKDLSIEELAEMMEISSSFMGLVERGERGLSLEKITKLITILNISFEDLIKSSTDLSMQEEKAGYKVTKKAKIDTIISLLSNLDESELNYLINIIKSFKQYTKNKKSQQDEV